MTGTGRSTVPPHQARGRLAVTVGLVLLFGTVIGLRLFAIEPLRVVSDSMEPTLRSGDHVVTETVSLPGGAERGALVTFREFDSDHLSVKRVCGLPGDRVAIRDGRLYVNSRRVAEPYLDHRTVDGLYFGPVRVPAGTVFLLGDNRAGAEDSREYGPVPLSNLVGRVILTW